MTVIYTYACPACGKIIRDTRHVVQRHTPCPNAERPKLYELIEIDVE